MKDIRPERRVATDAGDMPAPRGAGPRGPTRGGPPRLWGNTPPDEERLQVTHYRYLLPDDHDQP